MSDSKKQVISDIKELLWDLHLTSEKLSCCYISFYTLDEFDNDSIWSLEDLRTFRRNLKTQTRHLDKYIEKHIDSDEWEYTS